MPRTSRRCSGVLLFLTVVSVCIPVDVYSGQTTSSSAGASLGSGTPVDLESFVPARVVDTANLFAKSERRTIEEKLVGLEQQIKAQCALVTVNSTGVETIEMFSERLENRFEVGRETNKRYLLIVIAVKDRRLRIAISEGLVATFSDEYLGTVISQITALFRASKFLDGVVAGIEEIKSHSTQLGATSPNRTPRFAATTTSNGGMAIPLINDGGVFKVPVTINGKIPLDFVVDSGAADVSIPVDVVMVMMRTGTLTSQDFIGTQKYVLADGSVIPSNTFQIRTLQVGDRIIMNVVGSMTNVEGSLLLGQSFLARFKRWSINNERHVLELE